MKTKNELLTKQNNFYLENLTDKKYFYQQALNLTLHLNQATKSFLLWYANKYDCFVCEQNVFRSTPEMLLIINEYAIEFYKNSSITHRGKIRYLTNELVSTISDCLFDTFTYTSFKQNLKLVYKNHRCRVRLLERFGYKTLNTIPLKDINNIDAALYEKWFNHEIPNNIFINDVKKATDGLVLTLHRYDDLTSNDYHEDTVFITHCYLRGDEQVNYRVQSLMFHH